MKWVHSRYVLHICDFSYSMVYTMLMHCLSPTYVRQVTNEFVQQVEVKETQCFCVTNVLYHTLLNVVAVVCCIGVHYKRKCVMNLYRSQS
jgi:hypothetical protein